MNWSEYFFEICSVVSKKSKDLNTKNGCVIVSPMNEIVSTGFNGFPRDVVDNIDSYPERYNRPEKYVWTEHAERNAIYIAASRGIALRGCTIYITGMPCSDCSRAIIQSGIDRVNILKHDYEYQRKSPQYRFDVSFKMMKEAEIHLIIFNEINKVETT